MIAVPSKLTSLVGKARFSDASVFLPAGDTL
jgi:hypothetical protein